MTTADTAGEALKKAAQALTGAGVDSARLDARLLMAHALGLSAEGVFGQPDRVLGAEEKERFLSLVEKRRSRQPLSQIVGCREFWSLEFAVTTDTLTPRPDSETLIEAALAAFPDKGADLTILDLGTGTGCLLLTLLHERPGASGVGVDISEAALDVARANTEALGLDNRTRLIASDWGAELADQRFDLIVCNPPYIPEGDRSSLMPEVASFEPPHALFAGADGLDAYRTLIPDIKKHLRTGGRVFFEVGIDQADAVADMLGHAGFDDIDISKDLAGIGRCVQGCG
ncbi:MAG: peptide chain release factor N(5)-glutamine methyltransferase [Rhodospirillaceae bacterium]|nr:peptide chain release factor N(5)-glutamine methyltransferase [Rhodospirillaceae bacterium]MBT4219322.1 peptide chain release factor N(5)-glutamine methyltransferase [Rhodospirillaceae bacterium]MBT4464620.1 peptide chain release factor N(5)-glutamine methyltransferase [Rhodospirillaceae bacterium]MBT5014360.1 peptide chain release factor N(5)-glutamine methyltransferase [Rhodospirillaceae bacterium]MBT6405985.1 peptide chain release factor N(5)-glutamine methyltransferase [Rhodospirillaceae